MPQAPTDAQEPTVSVARTDLQAAAQDGLISDSQARLLWVRWSSPDRVEAAERLWDSAPVASAGTRPPAEAAPPPSGVPLRPARFGFTNTLYYFGGMLAISAMSLFMNLGWEQFGSWGLLAIALVYLLLCLQVADLLKRRQLNLPAGIFATLAVTLVPLAVWALQSGLGQWPPGGPVHYRSYHTLVDWRWLTLEFATLAAGVVLLWRYRLPFMVMPLALTLWYMSMDATPFLFGEADETWQLRRVVSLCFGLGMLALAVWVDLRTRQEKDYAFWLHLFGVIAFWGGLSLMSSDSELGKFLYLCVNLLMIATGTLLSRRVYAVFGGLGAAGYVGHLAYEVFKDSIAFPFILTGVGIAIVYLGVLWQRNETAIATRLRGILPVAMREMIERRR